jgi:hypothetical protein
MRPEIIERYGLDPEQVGVQRVGAADTADRADERAQRLSRPPRSWPAPTAH